MKLACAGVIYRRACEGEPSHACTGISKWLSAFPSASLSISILVPCFLDPHLPFSSQAHPNTQFLVEDEVLVGTISSDASGHWSRYCHYLHHGPWVVAVCQVYRAIKTGIIHPAYTGSFTHFVYSTSVPRSRASYWRWGMPL